MSVQEPSNYKTGICLKADCHNRDKKEYPVITGKCHTCIKFSNYKQGEKK